MKRLSFLIFSVIAFVAADVTPQEQYISRYSLVAVSEMKRTGVPASITLAQGLVESRAGQSPLASDGNNHFGIKCHNWDGRTIYQDDDNKSECFRAYPSAEASFKDHSDFLRYSDRYKPLFDLPVNDYRAWAKGLKKAGYATDPSYASKLIKVIEEYRLYEFDGDVSVDVPSPLVAEQSSVVRENKTPVAAREHVGFALSREEYSSNGVPFVRSVKGDSYSSIAKENSLFLKELLRFNDVDALADPLAELEQGTVVYLQPKAFRAAKGLDKYVVAADGESLREISQRFAVRLNVLRKKNKLQADAMLKEGDTLILR